MPRRWPERFGRYEILGELGAGGMGVVLQAYDPGLKRQVALKLLTEGLAGESDYAERFRREALALARLTHPNVVRVFDAGEQDGRPYYVMELLKGARLDARTAQLGELFEAPSEFDSKEFLDIFTPLADALAAVHAVGVLHRDIKPSNVMLGVPERGAVLTDFGLAALAGAPGLTLDGEIMGTSRYIAPEQISGTRATPASDVYGLGLCMYEYASRRVPFADVPGHVLLTVRMQADLPPIARLAPRVPAAVAALIDRAVRTDPARRFPTAKELHGALTRVRRERLDRDPRATQRISSPRRPAPARSGWKPAAAFAAALCLAAAALWPRAPEPRREPPRPVAPPIAMEAPIDIGAAGSGPPCGCAGPVIAVSGDALLVAWIDAAERLRARLSSDRGSSWTTPAIDGELPARKNQLLALESSGDRFYLLSSTASAPSGERSTASLRAVWTSLQARAWSGPAELGPAIENTAAALASRDGRLLAVWEPPQAGAGALVASSWGDGASGAWSPSVKLPVPGDELDDPVAAIAASEGLIGGRVDRLLLGELRLARSPGPGHPWSSLASGRLPIPGVDRKQPFACVDGERVYLVSRGAEADDGAAAQVAVSTDGFRTLARVYRLPRPPKGQRRSSRIAVRGDRVWVVWHGGKESPHYWASSRDGGASWTRPRELAQIVCWHPTPSLVVAGSGPAWVCWADDQARVRVMAMP